MTLKIYGIARSRAFRNIWLAEELGLDYEVIDIAPTDAHTDERLRALNPNARVPAIDDDGVVIWESIAINLYLAGKHRGELSADDAAEWQVCETGERRKREPRWEIQRTVFQRSREVGTGIGCSLLGGHVVVGQDSA